MPRSTAFSSLLFLSAFGLGASHARSAGAQAPSSAASAADREAARTLFTEGFALQQAGNYAEALDRFKRAQAVFAAPTTELHIAECDAQLGHLVEAAETYRSLTHRQLPPDAPAPFVAAQTQAAAELQQVEPRIPHIRIDVTPHGLKDLQVSVDDQPMNLALLEVDRPVDPGTHKITISAPGYDRAEAMVTVREREATKKVVIPMRAGAAPIMAPKPLQAQAVMPVPAGPGDPPMQAVPAAYVPPPEPYHSRTGIFFGPRLGGAIPIGDISSSATTGFSAGVEFDFRFARRFYFGAVVDHGFLGSGSDFGGSPSTTNGGVTFGVIINPDRFSAQFQVGVGYRTMSLKGSATPASGGENEDFSAHSAEGMLGAGLWIPIGRHVRLAPRIDLGVGSFDDIPVSFLSGQPALRETTTYALANFNLTGYFNMDFGQPPPSH